jgi:hypothetical protein
MLTFTTVGSARASNAVRPVGRGGADLVAIRKQEVLEQHTVRSRASVRRTLRSTRLPLEAGATCVSVRRSSEFEFARRQERTLRRAVADPVLAIGDDVQQECADRIDGDGRARTEHGTYVKEAIHGEGGATRPSLSELLGVGCVCRELDALAILDVSGEPPAPAAKPLRFGANLQD